MRVSLLVVTVVLVGCGPSQTKQTATTKLTTRSTTNFQIDSATDLTKLDRVLAIRNNSIEHDERKEITFEFIGEPTSDRLISAFDSLPWDDQNFSPYLAFGYGLSGLKIQRPDMDVRSPSIVVLWNDRSGDTVFEMVSNGVLPKDAVRELLIAFDNGEDISSLTDWTPSQEHGTSTTLIPEPEELEIKRRRFVVHLATDGTLTQDRKVISREQLCELVSAVDDPSSVSFLISGSSDLKVGDVSELQNLIEDYGTSISVVIATDSSVESHGGD